jgi:hypothetical protein
MKQAIGDMLYVTQSAYLVKNSRDLYYAHDYENADQQVDFLSFQEFLESIEVPDGKPVSFQAFQVWFSRYRHGGPLKDAHKLFEEFRGVITGPATDKSWLGRADYLALGVKESIFLAEEREAVYDVFEKYLAFLTEQKLYDGNIVSHRYLSKITPRYDFVIVDEVQDLTNIQLYLILKSLRRPQDFILCGDSNQIVHPNFFSWSKVKSLLYRQDDLQAEGELIRILNTNYRNSPQVTEIANRILKIKNQRFGSIDKESHYLVKSNGHTQGEVLLLEDSAGIRQELDKKTRTSTLFAVIVMNAEQKPEAARHFSTPLVFTIQEAKGLEYENIILYNFLTLEESRYREISRGVSHSDLEQDFKYARGKDKTDKALEVYKFYINALYVALTRAIKNLYWIESNARQSLLDLLSLSEVRTTLELASQNSSLDAWRQEAHKLELQGKQEQADRSDAYAKKKLAAIYELLEPGSMSIQVEHRLIKLDKSGMEFFLLNLMIALFYRVMPRKMIYRLEGFGTQDILDAIQHIPPGILPKRRKQRAYLSAILAKNEVDKDDRYNRKLFYRVMRGAYIFNPNLAVRVEGEWVNIYDLLSIDRLSPRHDVKEDWWPRDINEYRETQMNARKIELRRLLAEKRIAEPSENPDNAFKS